jgi:hypothetical protein
MSHIDDDAVFVPAELVHQFDDLLLAFWIQTTRDFVAEKEDRDR